MTLRHASLSIIIGALVVSTTALAQTSGRVIVTEIPVSCPACVPAPQLVLRSNLATFDPVARILAKKKDLKLAKTQEDRLAVVDAPVKTTRDALFKRIDSVQRSNAVARKSQMIGRADATTTAHLADADRLIDGLLTEMRKAYANAAEEALRVLNPEQLQQGKVLLDKLNEQMADDRLGKAAS